MRYLPTEKGQRIFTFSILFSLTSTAFSDTNAVFEILRLGARSRLLLETGDSVLAECAVKDRIWGIGLSMVDANRLDMSKWKGQNLLGFALMEVRRMLRDKSE